MLFVCACKVRVRVGRNTSNIRERTVSTMHVQIVMTRFLLLETRCKFYQSSIKSGWRENTTQDIRLFNERAPRWRCSEQG